MATEGMPRGTEMPRGLTQREVEEELSGVGRNRGDLVSVLCHASRTWQSPLTHSDALWFPHAWSSLKKEVASSYKDYKQKYLIQIFTNHYKLFRSHDQSCGARELESLVICIPNVICMLCTISRLVQLLPQTILLTA